MRPLRAGDYSFNQIGLSSFFMLLSNIPKEIVRAEKGFYPVGGCGGNSNAWHTEGDTLDVADADNLLRDIHVYVEAVVRLATAPFLPFDHRAAAQEIGEAVAEYAEACEDALDMNPVLEECAALIADLDEFYDAAEQALKAEDDPHEALADLDWVQMAIARELVPLNYAPAPLLPRPGPGNAHRSRPRYPAAMASVGGRPRRPRLPHRPGPARPQSRRRRPQTRPRTPGRSARGECR